MTAGFWSSETMHRRLPRLIEPYAEARVVNCSYELTLGSQVYITGELSKTRRVLQATDQINIPPGQFAQLLTRESVSVPNDALALISMKSGLKLRGLMNVSGFHVDPGFNGHLLFSVYNAGPNDIVLSEGSPAFLIWYATLDSPTADTYTGSRMGLASISDDDVMRLQGDVYTPHALADRVITLERQRLNERVAALETKGVKRGRRWNRTDMLVTGVIVAVAAVALTLLGTWIVDKATSDDSPSDPSPSSVPAITP